MNLFESFETILIEANKASQYLKKLDSGQEGVLKFINPLQLKDLTKQEINSLFEKACETAKINVKEAKSLSKEIKNNKKLVYGNNGKLTGCILDFFALWILKGKRNVKDSINDNADALRKAQFFYYHGNPNSSEAKMPLTQDRTLKEKKRYLSIIKELQKEGLKDKSVAFAYSYYDSLEKLMKMKSEKELKTFIHSFEKDFPEEKITKQLLDTIRKNLHGLNISEIISIIKDDRYQKEINSSSFDEIESFAKKDIIAMALDVEKSRRDVISSTASTIKGRKEEKKEVAREKKRSGEQLTPEEEKRALGGKGERNERKKQIEKMIGNISSNVAQARKKVYDLIYDIDLSDGESWDSMNEKEKISLLKAAKLWKSTAEWKNERLARAIKKLTIVKNPKPIIKEIKHIKKTVELSDNDDALSFFQSMHEEFEKKELLKKVILETK